MIINLSIKTSRGFLLFIYFFILSTLLFVRRGFITIWILIEISGLLFLCFTLRVSPRSRFTSNIVYFILQACFGIGILVSFISEASSSLITSLTTLFILTKVGTGVPLNTLYFYSIEFLDTLPIFLALSTQKMPPTLLFIAHYQYSSILPTLILLILSTLVVIPYTTTTSTLRSILITSRLFNSS